MNNDLLKKERILDIYSEFGQIGIWYCDKITKEEEVSKEWCQMIGYSYEELNPMDDDKFLSLIHPDDAKRTFEISKQLYDGKIAVYNHEFRLKHKLGHYIWVLSKAKVYSKENGKVKLVVGTHINIDSQKQAYEKMIKQKNAIISSFSRIIEERDAYTNSHLDNVAGLSVQIAMELGFNEEQLDQIWVAGKLHDIGKIHTPHEILNKPSRLTKEEFEVIKEHASHSYDLLKEFDFGFPLADIVGQHHERLDGSGYPNGIKGNEIMREAQIIAVADIADAMLSNRPYRNGLPKDIVLAELNRIRGIHYDEIIIDTTIDIISRRERY